MADDTDFRGAQLFEWASGQPDNHYNEDCAYVRTNDLLMNDFDCKNSWEGRALCEIEKKPGQQLFLLACNMAVAVLFWRFTVLSFVVF